MTRLSERSEATPSPESAPLTPQSDHPIDSANFQKSRTATGKFRFLLLGLLLLLGGGLGWWGWQGRQKGASSDAGAMFRQIPVGLATLKIEPVAESSSFVGNLESRNSVSLKPEIEGRVSQIYVEPGDRVTAGMPLIQLSPDKRQAALASVLASVNSARASRTSTRAQLQALQADRAADAAEVELQNEEYQRSQSLVDAGVLPRQNLDVADRNRRKAIAQLNATDQRIQAARASLKESEANLQQTQANANLATTQLKDTIITAPFDGIVGDIPVKIGDFADKATLLTTVTGNQSLELRLALPLERRSQLREGLQVELSDSLDNPLGTGRISFISPQVSASAQSILAKATFPNASGKLMDQQFVRARVIWNQASGILVPTEAISRLGGQTFVFVATQPDAGETQQPAPPPDSLIVRQRPVKLGVLQGNRYHILEGLKPGEQIVVAGVLNLRDRAAIRPESPRQSPESDGK